MIRSGLQELREDLAQQSELGRTQSKLADAERDLEETYGVISFATFEVDCLKKEVSAITAVSVNAEKLEYEDTGDDLWNTEEMNIKLAEKVEELKIDLAKAKRNVRFHEKAAENSKSERVANIKAQVLQQQKTEKRMK